MLDFLFEWSTRIIQDYGLLGLFVAMVVGSSPIPVPVEVFAITAISLGASPFYTVLFASLGATFGGLITYYIGKGLIASARVRKKYEGKVGHMKMWVDKYGVLAVFIFAAFPLPYDAMAFAVGGVGMRKRKFVSATFIGRLLRYAFVVAGGKEALNYLFL